MKILNLHFKNINSLIGENRVDFDQAPLADAGVFAITGPNGSGKTSILDAISLGLFGETFRFKRPSEHVMTKQTAESFAEVVFSAKGKSYRSSWSVSRKEGKENGEVLQPKMLLQSLNDEETVLADQPNKVKEKVAELIGMDFSGFSRSIMLPQGDFAAFLNALDNERMEILEKLISTDIYDDYKQQILEQTEQAKQEVEAVVAKINAVPVVDEAKKAALEEDLSDFNSQNAELRDQKNNLNQQLNWLKNIAAIEAKIVSLQRAEQTASAHLQETEADLKTIAENQWVLDRQADLGAMDAKDSEIKQQQDRLKTFNDEAQHLQNQLKSLGAAVDVPADSKSVTIAQQKQIIDDLYSEQDKVKQSLQADEAKLQSLKANIMEKQSARSAEQTWLKEHQSEAFLLDDFPDLPKLKNIRVELKGLQAKQKSYAKWSETTQSALEKNKSGLGDLEKKIARSKKKLEEFQTGLSDITHGNTEEDINELLETQEQRVVLYKDLLSLASAHKKLNTGGLLKTVVAQPELVSTGIRAELEEVEKQLEVENNILKVLERNVSHEALLKKYQVERVLLVDNEPCPLCGSLDHPYSRKTPEFTDSTQALKDQQVKIKSLQTQSEKLQQQFQLAQQREQKRDKKQLELIQIRSQWSSLCNKLNIAGGDMNIDNIRLMKKQMNSEKSDLNVIRDMQKNYQRQQYKIDKLVTNIKAREDMLGQLTRSARKLENDWNNRPQELKDIEKNVVVVEADLKKLTESISSQLQILGFKLPKDGKEDPVFDKVNALRQEYQTHHMRKQNLANEIEQLEVQMHTDKNDMDKLQQTIAALEEKIKQQQTLGLQLLLAEKQQQSIATEQSIVPLTETRDSLQQAIMDTMHQNGLETLSEYREMLSLVLRQAELQQKQLQFQNEIERLKTQQKQNQAQLETEKNLNITELNETELMDEIRSMMEKIDIVRQEINRLEKEKREIDTIEQQIRNLEDELQQKQQNFQACEQNVKEITAERGAKFRRKVQKNMAEKLLVIANNYLDKISGRYYLHQRDTMQGIALEVEDSYKNNIRRMPKTLSGGESFVVSLALALGLSELANNGQSVDSLFLDEGFGNLDEEALYLVVSTLKNLKTHGKSVGVISHIQGVKERIHTQIEMSRNPNGTSGFAVVS